MLFDEWPEELCIMTSEEDVSSSPFDPRTSDLLEHIAGTPLRTAILRTVAETPIDLRDLSDRLETPRTTARHNLKRMIEEGLVEETTDNEYLASALGRAVLSGLEKLDSHLETAIRLEPLLKCLDPAQLRLDLERLSDATVTTATRAEPFAPHKRLADLLGEATTLRGYFPTNPFLFNPTGTRLFEPSSGHRTLLFSADVARSLQDDLKDQLARSVTQSRLDLLIVPEGTLSYGVATVDDQYVIQGLDDNEKPHVLVESTDDGVGSWVEERLDVLVAEATPVGECDPEYLPIDQQRA